MYETKTFDPEYGDLMESLPASTLEDGVALLYQQIGTAEGRVLESGVDANGFAYVRVSDDNVVIGVVEAVSLPEMTLAPDELARVAAACAGLSERNDASLLHTLFAATPVAA